LRRHGDDECGEEEIPANRCVQPAPHAVNVNLSGTDTLDAITNAHVERLKLQLTDKVREGSHLAMQGAPMRGVQELVGDQSLGDDAAVFAPESGVARYDDLPARKPPGVAGSWRQFGDAEGVSETRNASG
jgi:hypothetical protein